MRQKALGKGEGSPELTELDNEEEEISNTLQCLENKDQLSLEHQFHTWITLERKINAVTHLNNDLAQRLIDITSNNLIQELEEELEKAAIGVLVATAKHFPEIVLANLQERIQPKALPHHSILCAMVKLCQLKAMAPYFGAMWDCVLPVLPLVQSKEYVLLFCDVLRHLASSVSRYLAEPPQEVGELDITRDTAASQAHVTFLVLFNNWFPSAQGKQVMEATLNAITPLFFIMSVQTLKNHLQYLITGLLHLYETGLPHFYITECLCALLDSVLSYKKWSKRLHYSLDSILSALFAQVCAKIETSDTPSKRNQEAALQAFKVLGVVYQEDIMAFLKKKMEHAEEVEYTAVLTILRKIIQDSPHMDKVKNVLVQSVALLITENTELVKRPLLQLIRSLGCCGYLTLPGGKVLVDFVIQQCEHLVCTTTSKDAWNDEMIQKYSISTLHLVPWKMLMQVVCPLEYTNTFIPVGKALTSLLLKSRIAGRSPYLGELHRRPAELPTPQALLLRLLVISLYPYKGGDSGIIALQLLHALHPINSLHPVMHSVLGQLWTEHIPELIKYLEAHTKETLEEKTWKGKLLMLLEMSVESIMDDAWSRELVNEILVKSKSYSHGPQDKYFPYKFYGTVLRVSRSKEFVREYLIIILQTSHQEEAEREGIASAISLTATRHLNDTLVVLQEFSNQLIPEEGSPSEQNEWRRSFSTLHLCYDQVAMKTKDSILPLVDNILFQMLHHFRRCTASAMDLSLKLSFLRSMATFTRTVGDIAHTAKETHEFSQKAVIAAFMMLFPDILFFGPLCCVQKLIEEESVQLLSTPVRQQAMIVVTNLRKLKPPLKPEIKILLVRTCYKSVFSLPPIENMLGEVCDSTQYQHSESLYKETISALRGMLEGLVLEYPGDVQKILEYIEPWLSSRKDHERERAMWCSARLLRCVAKLPNFDVSIEFSRLGRLVRLLALRCHDPVDNICFLAARAVYNLYCILLVKKQLDKGHTAEKLYAYKNLGTYSPSVFYNNTSQIAKAFAEYFTPRQLTNLVLTALDGLTDPREKISRAAGELLSAILDERGADLEKVDDTLTGIYKRLCLIQEPNTRQEMLRAVCFLAGNNTKKVVPILLAHSLPWDSNTTALWRVLGTRRETTLCVLQLLIQILEEKPVQKDNSSISDDETSLQAVAVTCALCEMLSVPGCRDAVQELYPRLLLAMLGHVQKVIEQNPLENMVVYRKECGQENRPKAFDPTSCALEAMKTLLSGAGYFEVLVYMEEHRGWDLLSSPCDYYCGIIEITSAMVKHFRPLQLHRIFKKLIPLLNSENEHDKVMSRAFYAQLLWHRSVAQSQELDILAPLKKWTQETNPIIKLLGLRGISNLALHPGKATHLRSHLPALQEFLKEKDERIAEQALKALRNIIYYMEGEEAKAAFCQIGKSLWQPITDESEKVRITVIIALGKMLKQVNKFKPGPAVHYEIYCALVPLMLVMQENKPEVLKACGDTLAECALAMGWTQLRNLFRHLTLSDHLQVLQEMCKYLVKKCRKMVGDILLKSLAYLKSPQHLLREAAVRFIAYTVKNMNLIEVDHDDVMLMLNVAAATHENKKLIMSTTLQAFQQLLNECKSRITQSS
ncbi:maestro heat-like repeat-containing protein family member 1 isoform D [Alligator mississippiensis]|uniref:Maestro heat-like repeat-containing protein family member 1 isoform D n=1 Tax=Alligator mississippiensis TaxID=8496 RepID=A0A151MH84_ALLMI|nr:maestro heat-like repeat-containing protein family member 1 isoform D [Alligator mississippiensis]